MADNGLMELMELMRRRVGGRAMPPPGVPGRDGGTTFNAAGAPNALSDLLRKRGIGPPAPPPGQAPLDLPHDVGRGMRSGIGGASIAGKAAGVAGIQGIPQEEPGSKVPPGLQGLIDIFSGKGQDIPGEAGRAHDEDIRRRRFDQGRLGGEAIPPGPPVVGPRDDIRSNLLERKKAIDAFKLEDPTSRLSELEQEPIAPFGPPERPEEGPIFEDQGARGPQGTNGSNGDPGVADPIAELKKFVMERRKQLEQDQMIKVISEGLGSTGFRMPGEVLQGAEKIQPYVAEGLRERIAENQFYGSEEMDPTSEISEAAQNLYGDTSGAPAGMLREAAPYLARQRGLDIDAEQLKHDRDMEKKEILGKERLNISGDADHRQMMQGLRSARSIRSLLFGDPTADPPIKPNPIGANAAIVGLAKAAGEKGVLTERDVGRFKKRPGIMGIYDESWKFIASDFSPEVKRLMMDLADVMEAAAIKNVGEYLDARKKSFRAVYPGMFSDQEIDGVIGSTANLSSRRTAAAGAQPVSAGAISIEIPSLGKIGTVPNERAWEGLKAKYPDAVRN